SYYMTNIWEELNCLGVELTENELREMVNLSSINSFIEDEADEKNKSENNICEDDLLSRANLVLEETVNLKDPIFQEEDIVPHETSSNTSSDTNDNNGKSSGSIDFNPENLVDAILNEML
ncbi:16902_t:CDS:1, partial [Racocetra persica]